MANFNSMHLLQPLKLTISKLMSISISGSHVYSTFVSNKYSNGFGLCVDVNRNFMHSTINGPEYTTLINHKYLFLGIGDFALTSTSVSNFYVPTQCKQNTS